MSQLFDPGPPSYTVTELTNRITTMLEAEFGSTSIWVRGEMRNLYRSKAGHVYFHLVEASDAPEEEPAAMISVVLFSGTRQRVNQQLGSRVRMQDGVRVCIEAYVDYYPPRGSLQLRMVGIDPNYTLGDLELKRAELRDWLNRQGLLERNKQVPFPVAPLRVGLVTSEGSAAYADFCNELEESGMAWEVVLAHTSVQGRDAERGIAAGVVSLGAHGVDVVAVVRGGGARTDLAAFDSKLVAQAIATCPVPVLTGIGHETDNTIADEVAHEALKTPTACAARLVDAAQEHLETADQAWTKIVARAVQASAEAEAKVRSAAGNTARAVLSHLQRAQQKVSENSERARRLTSGAIVGHTRKVDGYAADLKYRPASVLQQRRDRLDRTVHAVLSRAEAIPKTAERRLAERESRLQLLDPQRILARGWSVTRRNGRAVRDAAELSEGDELETTLATGRVISTVKDKETQEDTKEQR